MDLRPFLIRRNSLFSLLFGACHAVCRAGSKMDHWGDFNGDPLELVKEYFDGFLYWANWASKQLMLRLPRTAVDVDAMRAYCIGESVCLHVNKKHVILDITFNDDNREYDTDEDEGLLSVLLNLRNDLMKGDYRCIYLAWLMCATAQELDDEDVEPPVPPGLASMSAALKAFTEFFQIDRCAIEIAARESAALQPSSTDRGAIDAWVHNLAQEEKDAILSAFLAGDGAAAMSSLRSRFHRSQAGSQTRTVSSRTVGDLLDAASELAEERQQAAEEKAAREEAERQRQAARARARHLDSVAGDCFDG